jgi:radical SAM protein with 4Fe4S-binding SPASM domain
MRDGTSQKKGNLAISDWKRLVEEAKAGGVKMILLRGGEPFLLPGVIELIEFIVEQGLFACIDSNGMHLAKVADDLVRIGHTHVTVSVDGSEPVHDAVRGVPGCYQRIADGFTVLKQCEQRRGREISKSITFTISQWSYRDLGVMPDVARSLGIGNLCIVPYFYLSEALGQSYARELDEEFGCHAYSWRGFCHETSGVDRTAFLEQLRAYRAGLRGLSDYPYLPLTEEEYCTWFADPSSPVRLDPCYNAERLIDVQPNGDANCCVDFPDYSFGNVRNSTLAQLWNGERARKFRERRRLKAFSACHRCGAKYMAMIRD